MIQEGPEASLVAPVLSFGGGLSSQPHGAGLGVSEARVCPLVRCLVRGTRARRSRKYRTLA
jgi:hypothetical protein